MPTTPRCRACGWRLATTPQTFCEDCSLESVRVVWITLAVRKRP